MEEEEIKNFLVISSKFFYLVFLRGKIFAHITKIFIFFVVLLFSRGKI
jgi:hypothetical protein